LTWEERKMKTQTIIFTLVSAICAASLNAQTRPINAQLTAQYERLNQIDRFVSTERRQIERRHQYALDELLQDYAMRFQRSDMFRRRGDEELLWIEFFEFLKVATHEPQRVSSFSDILSPFVIDAEAHALRRELLDSYFLLVTRTFLTDSPTFELLGEMAYGNTHSPLVRRKARRLLKIMEEFTARLEALEKRRATNLSVLEQTQKRLKNDVHRMIRQRKTRLAQQTDGTISAIGYDQKNPICMIDGVRGVLKPGSTITNGVLKGAKVLNINRFNVEFEKDGAIWTLKIGQMPM